MTIRSVGFFCYTGEEFDLHFQKRSYTFSKLCDKILAQVNRTAFAVLERQGEWGAKPRESVTVKSRKGISQNA